MRPINADTYKRKLFAIIRENPDYWLKSENSNALYWEYIDRHELKLGYLKEALLMSRIPTMDTVSKRVREIKEDLRRQAEQPKLTPEEVSLQSLIEATK